MRVLTIGTDRKLFEEGSNVLLRAKKYAREMEEYHVIVFSLKKHSLKEIHLDNLHIYPTNSDTKLSYIFDAIKIGSEICKNFGISIISCQDPFECGFVGSKVSSKFKIPLQIQIHTDFLDPYFKNSFLNRIRVYLSKLVLPKASGLRVVSSVIKDSILKKYPNIKARIDVLPIFVDIEKFEKIESVGEPISPYTILMISRLTKEKNISLAINSLKKINKNLPNEGLYIVGDGDQEKNIWQRVKEYGLEDKVKIVGWKNQDVIRSLYKSAKIFLLTSDFEGYGMTLVEAGASGCPIVTTKVGLAKTDLFEDGVNSYICPVGDVDCLTLKLEDLIINEEKRKSFANNMHAKIKSISVSEDKYISTYINLLEQLIKNV